MSEIPVDLEDVHRAIERIAAAENSSQVGDEIVRGARRASGAAAALLYPYDPAANRFTVEGLALDGISDGQFLTRQNLDPEAHLAAHWLLAQGYLEAPDLAAPGLLPVEPGLQRRLEPLEVASLQGLVLSAQGNWMGVLYLFYATPGRPETGLPGWLEHFGRLAAMLWKKARDKECADQALEAAREVAQASAEGDLKYTLRVIVQNARNRLGCDIATVYAYSEESKRFTDYEGVGNHLPNSLRKPDEIRPPSSLYRILEVKDWYWKNHPQNDPILNSRFVLDEGIQSTCGLKLLFQGRAEGVLMVNYRAPHDFTREEEGWKQFGRQAAAAIHNAQMYKAAQRQAQVLRGLYQAGQEINSSLDLDQTLSHIAEQALILIGPQPAAGCYSHVAVRDGCFYEFEAAAPAEMLAPLKDLGRRDLRVPPIGIVGRAMCSNSPQRVPDIGKNRDYIPLGPGIRSELSVPLRSGGRVIGGLSVEYPAPNAFTDEDYTNLQLLANQASVALDNARQFFLIQGLLEAVKQTNFHANLASTLRLIAGKARRVFACDLISIYTYSPDTEEISFPCVTDGELWPDEQQAGDIQPEGLSQRLKIDRLPESSVLRRMLRDEGPHYAADTFTHSVLGGGGFVRNQGIRSSAGICLQIEQEVVGFLFLNYRCEHEFVPVEQAEIELLATYAAIAISGARQSEDLREALGLVGGRAVQAWMDIYARTWQHNQEDQTLQIDIAVGRLKELVRDAALAEDVRQQVDQNLARISRQALALQGDMISPTQAPVEDLPVWIDDLIQETLDDLQYLDDDPGPWESVKVETDLQIGQRQVSGSYAWLRYVLESWIKTAARAMQGCSPAKLKVSSRAVNDRARIEITDTGRGLSAAEYKRLDQGRPDPRDRRALTTLVVQAIAQAYEGRAWLPRQAGEGVTLVIEIPLVGYNRGEAIA